MLEVVSGQLRMTAELKPMAQVEAELAEIRSWIGDVFQWPHSQTMFAPWAMLKIGTRSTYTNRWGDKEQLLVFDQVRIPEGGETMLFIEFTKATLPEIEALRNFHPDMSGHQGVWLAWFLWKEQKLFFSVMCYNNQVGHIFKTLRNLTREIQP